MRKKLIRSAVHLGLFVASLYCICSQQASASTGVRIKPVQYLALGASETLGFGLRRMQSYPYIAAKRCGFSLRVFADFGEPSLDENPPTPTKPYVLSLFVGTNDLVLSKEDVLRKLRLLRPKVARAIRSVVFLAPDIASIPAFEPNPPRSLLIAQEFLDAAVEHLYSSLDNVEIIHLRLAAAKSTLLLLPDGIHPSAIGQERLAQNMTETLKGMCRVK